MNSTRNIAIIGIGPRGGFALEKLIEQLVSKNAFTKIHFYLFEQTDNYGNGPVYSLQQNPANWINITERVLDLPKRDSIKLDSITIEEFPAYRDWAFPEGTYSHTHPDTYPPRAKMGTYLSQRFRSLAEPLIKNGMVTFIYKRVDEIQWQNNGQLRVKAAGTETANLDEVLLTIGHQPTENDTQIKEWESFARQHKGVFLFKEAYPIENYLDHQEIDDNCTIGIRGFGLAMIDATRAIAQKYGSFIPIDEEKKSYRYETEHSLQNLIVPFSLEGLPAVPKPLNGAIDSQFKPTEEDLSKFHRQIADKETQQKATSPDFLLEAFAPIVSEIYLSLPDKIEHGSVQKEDIELATKQWLLDQSYKSALFVPTKQAAIDSMKSFVAMALGDETISLDFCIGQVWRHCQPTIYDALSHNKCNDDVFASIVKIDESTKRYSYGPPVESIQQMIALVEAGVLTLNFVNDPDIKLTENGWELLANNETITASVMIDSVIDSPKVKAVTAPLVRTLLADDIMQAVHSDLGISTDEYGYLQSDDVDKKIPIALLGRLAKGTVIGVDAILECFGKRPVNWAAKAAENHKSWLDQPEENSIGDAQA